MAVNAHVRYTTKSWPKRIGPTTGQSAGPVSTNGVIVALADWPWSGGSPVRPMKLDSPVPKSTTPSPVTIWFTRSVMLITATTVDISAPAATATTIATQTLPVSTDAQNAVTAP